MRQRVLPVLVALLVLWATQAVADTPTPADLTCSQGEDCRKIIVIKPGGVPADLTGFSFRAQVRASASDLIPLAEFVVDASELAKGKVTVTLPAARTAQLAGKVGTWDLQQTSPSGLVSYPLRGAFKCYWSATRP